MGEFSQLYCVWFGGTPPNYCIAEQDFRQDKFIMSQLDPEIRLAMLATQEFKDVFSLFKIIIARPQSTNEASNKYDDMILCAVDNIRDVHCVLMALDGLSTERSFMKKH